MVFPFLISLQPLRSSVAQSARSPDLAKLAFPYVLKQDSHERTVLASALLMAAFHEAYPCAPK